MIWLILGGLSFVILLASQTSIEGGEGGNVNAFNLLPVELRQMAQNAIATGDPVIMTNTANSLEVAGYKDAADALRRMAATAKPKA